jgi:hypothetical protein
MANEFKIKHGFISTGDGSIEGGLRISGAGYADNNSRIATRPWVTQFLSDNSYATSTDISDAIDALVASAPGTLDTLNELAAAIGDDPSFATNITTLIGSKLSLSGGSMTGDITFTDDAEGIVWSRNTDGASIKFYNTADGDTDSRLEFHTNDNNNEYFRWTHGPSGGALYEVMKLMPTGAGSSRLTVAGDIYAASNKVATETHVSANYLSKFHDITLTLTGDVSGSGTFNNMGNLSFDVQVADDSHNHDGRYYTETEIDTLLEGKLSTSGGAMTGDIDMAAGKGITFYGNGNGNHGIFGKDASGTASDDIRINSYHNVHINLDSNSNNSTETTFFTIGQHGAEGALSNVFTVDGAGNVVASGTLSASGYNNSNWDTAYDTTQSLGSAAFESANTFAAASHTHVAADITDAGHIFVKGIIDVTVSNDTFTFTTNNGTSFERSISDANTNYYLNGISKSGNTLTFSVSGATNQTYTFGSNAFTSYTDHSTAGYALANTLGSLALEDTVTISEVVGLETALNGKLSTTGKAADSEKLDGIDSTGFVKQLGDTDSPDYQTPSSRRVDPNASNPTNHHYAITTFGNGGNVTGQLATHFQTGKLYSRGYNSSWSSWQAYATESYAAAAADAVNVRITEEVLPSIPTNNNQLTNGAGYITDGNTNWNNTYGFITASSTDTLTNKSGNISQWTNDSGYITDGNTGWNNTYGFITSSDNITGTSAGVNKTVAAGSEANLLYASIGSNDFFRIRTGGASNAGFVEIATADDGTEPIYVRQYTGVFSTLKRTATLLDGSGNTSFPGTVTAPTFSGALSGNASTASSAAKLTTARNIALSGAVTGNANFDGSGNITISTTATSDPTLTLNGDATGSATFTNLGNATLTVTVANDSHTHDGRYYTESESNARFVNVTGDTVTGDLSISGATLSVTSTVEGTEAFFVDGVNGRLFTISDDLSDSLFSANTISGLPVIEAFADNTVKLGPYSNPVVIDSAGSLTIGGATAATQSYVDTSISNLIGGAPGALNTLNELAAAINDDASFASSVTSSLGLKAPLASPALTGNPTAPTQAASNNSTRIATTAFVKAQGYVTTDTNYYLDGISRSGNVLTFSVNGATNQTYTFGSAAWAATTAFDAAGSADTVNQRIDNEILPLIETPAITSNGSTPSLNSGITAAEIRTLIGAGTSSSDTNYYLSGASFNTGNGVLTLTVSGATNQTVDLDGRYAYSSHNHTSLSGVTSIGFAAQSSDSASITTTISGTSTFFDFNLTDDNNNDWWRWRFTPSGSTVYDAMILKPASNGNANLTISGSVYADNLNIANWNTAHSWGNHAGLYDSAGSAAAVEQVLNTRIEEDVLPSIPTVPTNVSAFTNDAGYITDGNTNWNNSYGFITNSVTDFYVADQILHTGDTNTYIQFHAADQWRVVTGGSERLEVNNSAVTVQNQLNVNGNILLTGSATTTNQARMIDFTGFDKEGTTDFSDRAYISHTTATGGHTGSVLVISSQNDSGDGIAFLTHASSKLKHNGNNLATESFASDEAQAVQDNLDNLAGGLGSLALEDSVTISEVDGLQTALNGKLSTTGKAADSNLLDGLDSSVFMRKSANSILDMNNFNIQEVNHISFNDPGYGEGIAWANMMISESPDDLSNQAGNLHIANAGDASIRVTIDPQGNLYPSRDRLHLLGKDTNRWQIVFCEILDSAGQHEKNLQNPEGEKSVSEYETGTVLVWKGGKNVPCVEYADHMRMGIAVKGIDSPLIQGAEPVLVTGIVKEGDYLITSRKEGHAEAISPKLMRQQGLYDCVLGKALENGEGESYLVKTWINI